MTLLWVQKEMSNEKRLVFHSYNDKRTIYSSWVGPRTAVHQARAKRKGKGLTG